MKAILNYLLFLLTFSITGNLQAQKTGWDTYELKGKIKSLSQREYKFIEKDKKGKRVGSYIDNFDILFNKEGYEIKKDEFNHFEGKLYRRCTFKYDNKGYKVEKRCYLFTTNMYEKETYKYDDNGNMIESNEYNRNGSLEFRKTYKYDDNKNVIELYQYKNKSLFAKVIYKYNNEGELIEFNTFTDNGSLLDKVNYKYDSNGNLIEELHSDNKNYNSKETYKYELDKNGNWIKKITFKYKDKSDTFIQEIITERIIVYFD